MPCRTFGHDKKQITVPPEVRGVLYIDYEDRSDFKGSAYFKHSFIQ